MAYVTVKEENEEKLRFSREPELKAWGVLIGLISLGLGAALYSNDYLVWKITYVSGSVFVALNCMEDWEDCELDKSTGKYKISRTTLIQRLFQLASGPKILAGYLTDIVRVAVESEEVKFVGSGYCVVLHFEGYSLGITETATFGDKSEHELIAEKIHSFLDLDAKRDCLIQEGLLADDDDSSTDDDFEQITKADVMEALINEVEKVVENEGEKEEQMDKKDE